MFNKFVAGAMLFSTLFSQMPINAFHDIPACYRDIEEHFFIPEVVAKALSLHDIYQSQWDIIVQDLQRRSLEVGGIVDARARRMRPDPLSRPIRPKEAKDLLMEVLFEIFVEVLHQRDFTNQADIREMFNYIRRQQSFRLKTCFGIEDITPEIGRAHV